MTLTAALFLIAAALIPPFVLLLVILVVGGYQWRWRPETVAKRYKAPGDRFMHYWRDSLALMEAFECGTTKLPAKGGFTNVEKTVIYFVVNRFQIARMKNIVHAIDPAAYLTISEVADVFKSVAPTLPEKEEAAEK